MLFQLQKLHSAEWGGKTIMHHEYVMIRNKAVMAYLSIYPEKHKNVKKNPWGQPAA